MTNLIWLVEAETFTVPGRILRAFTDRAKAEVEAAQLAELIRQDGDHYTSLRDHAPATVDNWRDLAKVIERVAEVRGTVAYVTLTSLEVT